MFLACCPQAGTNAISPLLVFLTVIHVYRYVHHYGGVRAMSLDMFFDYPAVRLNEPKSGMPRR